MSRMPSLILLAVAVSLLFVSGCKDKPAPEGEPVKVVPTETKSESSTVSADPVVTVPAVPAEKNPDADASAVVTTVSNAQKQEPESGHDAWMTDFKAAMKKAADEKKDMLLEFTGSDWCPGCIKLNKEVFSKKEFVDEASKDFVLVFLDSPRGKKLAPGVVDQNNQLSQKYGVQYLPTVCLTDAKGSPYAQITGYQQGGPKAYLAQITEYRKTKTQIAELLAKAESDGLDDLEKAKIYDKALNLMSSEMAANSYSHLIDKIIALDSENKAGLRDNYLAKKDAQKAVEQLQAGNVDKGVEIIDKIISDYKMNGQTTQEIYYLKALAIRGKGDNAAIVECLKKSVEAAPDSEMASHINNIINTHFSKPEPTPASNPVPVKESTSDDSGAEN